MPVQRNYNDDDEKKKSGGSSSASSSSKGTPNPSSSLVTTTSNGSFYNRSDVKRDLISTGKQNYLQQNGISTSGMTLPNINQAYANVQNRLATQYRSAYGRDRSSGNGGGSSSGGQNYADDTPSNATQALMQNKNNAYGLQGVEGIGNGLPDIYGDNWYRGDQTTSVDYAARIVATRNGDPALLEKMWKERFTVGSATYNPYAGITSEPTQYLASLIGGVPEGGFTTEWFEKNASKVAPYLNASDTTGSPKKPGKRASKEEKIAYYFYQAHKDAEQTDKAEKELAALREEMAFKAGDKSRNSSDADIIASVDWSKYPTLRKMDEQLALGTPMQLTRGVDWDQNYLAGMIWAGRNGGGTGDAFTDAVNARLGAGNLYQYDQERAAKLDVNSPDYDPYSVGSTMSGAQLYYGQYDFGQDFLDSHRADAQSGDSTKSRNYLGVYDAFEFTQSCNDELAALKEDLDEWLTDTSLTDDDISEKLDEIFSDTEYKNIQKLNKSLERGALLDTTGAIGTEETRGLYKRSNLERYIRETLADNAAKEDPHDSANNTGKGLGGALDSMYSTLGNFFTGLFGPKEQYVPKDENGNPVEVKPEPSKAHVQSSALPPLQELIDQGIAVQTASATVSDVGGSLAARPTPTPFPSATPAPGTNAPTATPAGPSREDYENAKKDSEAWQQESLQKRQNMAQGKFALRETSTPTEKQTYKTSYPEFEDDVTAIKDGIENGSMTEQQGYDSMVQSADALAAKTYFSDVETTEAYQSLQNIIAQEEAQLAGMPDIAGSTMPVNPQTGEPMTEDELIAARIEAQQTGDAERWEYLSKFGAAVQTDEDKRAIAERTAVEESLQQHRIQLAGMQQQYDEAQEHLKGIRAKYDMADEMATEGVDTGLGVRATDIMDAIRNGFGEVNLPDWNAWSVYDYAERSGESSQEEIAAAARENIAKDDEGIAQIQGMLDMVDQYGLNIPERYRANMEETLRQYQENKKDSQYYLLRTNPDFAEKVAAADSEEKWGKEKFHTGSSIGYALYAFKHGTKDRQLYAQYPLMGEMSQEELDTALYLLETQGPITADEYYLHLGDSQYGRLNTRFAEDAVQQAVGIAKGSAVGGTLLSVAMAPLNSTGSFQIIFDKVTGRKSNPNSILSAGQKASAAMRQEAKGKIVGAIADPFGGADSAVGKVAGFVYDGITSAGDTAANLAVGRALGIVGTPLDNKLKVSAMNMATAAGTSSYNEAIQKGGTEEQATMMGIASFMGEWLTEAIEMSDIMDAISTGASEAADGAVKGIKAFLKKQIPELGNEVVGESVSDVIERVSDEAIMGELSDKAKAVEGYTKALMDADPNMTEQLARSEAEYQAKLDGWKSTAYAGLQGGFSAGISTTGGYVAGNFATTTDQFLRTFAVQRGLEAQGLPKANARVAARNIVAVGADNTTVYGPQLNAELAENEAQMAAEEAAAEDLNRRTHEFAEDLNSDAAREEQNNLRQANAEQQTTETEQPTSEEQNNTATAIRSTRQVATSEQSRANRAEFSRRMFALEQGSMGGATQQVVAITSVLDQGETSSDELTTAQARAAAQGLVETFGDRATSVIQRLMMKARNEGVDYGALAQAVQVAGLTDGAANQAFAGLQPWGISTENFNAFMQAANADMADQAIRDQMRKRTYDVMIAAEKARLISEGAAKALQASAERKQEARRRRQYAQEQHEIKQREVEATKERIQRASEEYEAEVNGDTENALRDAVSDLPGAIIAEQQMAQSEESAIANEAKVNKEAKAQETELDAELTRRAQEIVDQRIQAVYEARQRRAEEADAQARARAEAETAETNGAAETIEPQTAEVTEEAPVTETTAEAQDEEIGVEWDRAVWRRNENGTYTPSSIRSALGVDIDATPEPTDDPSEVRFRLTPVTVFNTSSIDNLPSSRYGNRFLRQFDTRDNRRAESDNRRSIVNLLNSGRTFEITYPNGEYYRVSRNENGDIVFTNILQQRQFVYKFDDAVEALGRAAWTRRASRDQSGLFNVYNDPQETTASPVTAETAPTAETTTAPATDDTQAEGTIQASNIGAPNPTAQSQSTEPIKSGAQIIEELENAIGIPVDDRRRKYLRGKRNTTAGYTARGKNIVHIQDSDDVETAAHEIGHKVSEEFNLSSIAPTQKMVDFLENHPDPKVRAWIKSYDPNVRTEESIAEFCKYWMVDRGLAVQFAGEDFVNEWENKLASRGWLRPMQRASEDLRLNRAATNADRAVASVVMETKDNRDKYEKGVLGFLTSFADYTLPLLDMEVARKEQEGVKVKGIVAYNASSDPRTLMLARNGGSITNFVNTCMEETMVNPEGNPVMRDDGTEWGSFQDILKDIDISRAPVFGAIWELQNAKDRRKYGKDVFAKDIDIDAAYDQLARENPDLVEAYKKANAWMAKFIETWVVDTGMLGENGKALWKRMRTMYPNWAPAFHVTKEQERITSATNYRSPTSGMMRANGSTKPVIDPVLGCAEYVKRYVTNYRTAEALRGLISSAKNIKGFSAVMEPAQFDLKTQSETTQNDVVTRSVFKALEELQNTGDITDDGVSKIEDVINNLPDISFFAKRQDGTDVINVPMPDGSINSQTVYQPAILRAMTVAPASQRNRWLQAVGNIAQSLTGFLTANATARSLAFSEQNVFSDSETAMVTGYAAGNPLTYTLEWIKTAGYHLTQNIKEAQGQDIDQKMQLFKLFGAYGSRFSVRNEDDQIALRRKLFKSKSTLGEKVTLPIRAIEAITGFGEDTTRLMQFLSSYDKLIKAGVDPYDARLISGKIAHEASTDFKKSGAASNEISGIKKIIPFFNGQLQGVYKTVRMFSKENAGHRTQMLQRMVFSSLMTSLVASALREMLCSDKDKEEYDMLTAQERNKYHHIKIGDRWWRFKKSQDGIIQMADNVGEVLGNLLTGYEGDELGDLCSLSQSVASNMILTFDTVFDPVIDAWNGVTWSGQSTVDHELAGLSVTQQYNASTPWICRALSNIPVFGKKIAPQGWEYILKQYTGSAGMLGSEMMALFTEDKGTAENALYVFRNHFASKLSVDPIYSNALASTYKESKNNLTEAINDAKAGHTVAHFRPNLTQSQVDKGIKEAQELTSSKGKLSKIGKDINELWKKHEEILKDTNMTKEDRATRAREVRVQINSKYLQANEIMGDYWTKYGYRSKATENIGNFLSTVFIEKRIPKYKKK